MAEIIESIGSGLDHADYDTWEAATDISQATDWYTGYLVDSEVRTTSVDMSGATDTSITNHRTLRAALALDDDASVDQGTAAMSGGVIDYNTSHGSYFSTSGKYVELIDNFQEEYSTYLGLQFSKTNQRGLGSCRGVGSKALNCFFVADLNSGAVIESALSGSDGGLINCYIHNTGASRGAVLATFGGRIINCFAFASDASHSTQGAFEEGSGTGCDIHNTAAAGFAGGFIEGSGTWETADYNWGDSDDVEGSTVYELTADGTDITDEIEDAVLAGGLDFTIKTGAFFDKASNGGLTRAGVFDALDFFGVARASSGNACDIGPMETVAAGGGPTNQPAAILL